VPLTSASDRLPTIVLLAATEVSAADIWARVPVAWVRSHRAAAGPPRVTGGGEHPTVAPGLRAGLDSVCLARPDVAAARSAGSQ